MRLLLVTGYSGSWPYIPEMVDELAGRSHDITVFDIENTAPVTLTGKWLYRVPRISRSYLAIASLKNRLHRLDCDFDAVNIHYVAPIYKHLVHKIRSRGRRFITSIWGSELLRADVKGLGDLHATLQYSDYITTNNPQIRDKLETAFPYLGDRIRIIPFGMKSVDVIRQLASCESAAESRRKLNIPQHSVTIACGYNNIRQQQHLLISQGFANLPPEVLERLCVILPMTYPADEVYRRTVESAFRDTGVRVKVFDKKMSIEDICRLRLATDCAINVQVTDSLSASIQEHLVAGSALIVGDWLPYQIFEKMGAKITRVGGASAICAAVERVVKSLSQHRQTEKCAINIYNYSCWAKSADRWLQLYDGRYQGVQLA